MANFPSFGNANRQASLFEKPSYPNIQFAANVNHSGNSPKTATIKISIINLKTELVASTLERIFNYSLENINNDLNPITNNLETIPYSPPVIHFEINISKATGQSVAPPSTLGGLPTTVLTITRTANIDILIDNLQTSLLTATLQRIKSYMAMTVNTDMNP